MGFTKVLKVGKRTLTRSLGIRRKGGDI